MTVPDVEGIIESLAVNQIEAEGLQANVRREPRSDTPIGIVAEQDPEPPNRIEKGNFVTIVVSTGKPKTRVPGVVGRSRDDAVVALRDADLTPRVVEINSERPTNTVTAQSPRAGTTLVEGSIVRINVSIGPKPIAVPSVVGVAYESAASQLQGIGFGVARTDVESNEPAGIVVGQNPNAGASAGKGSTITLQVSEGPTTSAIPDVTSQQADQARSQLEGSGFRVRVVPQDTEDPLSDGNVISQDPPGGQEAKPGHDRDDLRRPPGRAASRDDRHGPDPDGHWSRAARHRADRHGPARPVSRRIRVAVLAGGRSSEHEISLASARSVVAALDPGRYEVQEIAIGREGRWELGEPSNSLLQGDVAATLPVVAESASPARVLGSVDVVVPILHGPFGEDGTVQGLLELAGVPYVGAGVAASALCMDKDLFKAVLRDRGIPVARNATLRLGDEVANPFGYPVFVKPARLGSSVGISKAHHEAELEAAVALARRHDEKVLVEEFVAGTEVECGVLGNLRPAPVASVVGEIVPHAEWYDYDAKYAAGGSDIVVPARIPDATAERVQELAIEAFVATECEGMARVDFFVREGGEVVVNELNTIPGFTETSVYARLFEASGIPYAQLLDRLIELALERHERRAGLEY